MCIALLSRPTAGILYFAVAGLTMGLLALAARYLPFGVEVRIGVGVVGVLAVGIAARRLYRRADARRRARRIADRDRSEDKAATLQGSPYRGRLRRAARAVAPPVPGSLAAMVVGGVLALTAGVIPLALKLPRWIENEVIVLAWWAVWAAAFAVLLFRGWRLADDTYGLTDRTDTGKGEGDNGWLEWVDVPWDVDAEGCVVGLVIAVLLALAVGGAFLVAEFVIPALLVGAYWIVVRGLRRVANDRHDCAGHLGRALVWGVAWATLYTGPLAALVWAVHVVLAAR